MNHSINLPLDKSIISNLKCGDRVTLTGYIYTARDAAHKRMFDILKNGEQLPINLQNETIYYAGPCPAPPGSVIGSIGPTTSCRMDAYAPVLLDNGLLGMIGKGFRNDNVIEAIKRNNAIYFGATGGAGALIASRVKSVEIVAFSELGTEAIRKIYVEDFPVIVLIDSSGNDLYKINIEKYKKI